MRKILAIVFVLEICSCAVFGTDLFLAYQSDEQNRQGETERLARMTEVLQKNTLEEFWKAVRAHHWNMPRIPSQWFIDTHVSDEKGKLCLQALRDFGDRLALKLDGLAEEQQTLLPNDGLFQRTLLLFEFKDWLSGTAGYDNFFLAQRCLALTAVGLTRLTASLAFPLEKCEEIAVRMNPEWLEMPYRLQVLNGEANATIFINANITDGQLNEHWQLAKMLPIAKKRPDLVKAYEDTFGPLPQPDATLVNVGAFTDNLHFFGETERSHRVIVWDRFRLESSTYDKALSLLKFRTAVGFFPPPFVRGEEETKRLNAEITEYANWGMEITKAEDSPSYDPLKEAFRREWGKLDKKKTEGVSYATAFEAYKAVRNGMFFDSHTAEKKRQQKIETQK